MKRQTQVHPKAGFDARSATLGELTGLHDRQQRRIRRTRNVERREAERRAAIIGNEHVDEIRIRIAEMREGYIQSSRNVVDNGVAALK